MASPRPFSTAARVHPAIPVFHPQIVAKMQSSIASSPSSAARRVKMLGRRVALPATGVLALGMLTLRSLLTHFHAYLPTHLDVDQLHALPRLC